MPIIVSPTKKVCQCVKNVTNAKIVKNNLVRSGKKNCGEVMCQNCDEFVYPNLSHRCYMKPVESDEEKQEKQNKNRQKRQQLTEKMVNEEVEEEEV